MYGEKIVILIHLTVFIAVISACAKISSPSGGPRDKTPPKVIKSIPENGTKNFKGQSIAITFDEYVVLENINDKFMVSPPMKKKPRVFIRGKNVNVEYEDVLRDSTTYTFYFLDAIKDLNEGNKIDDYQFVFSTGSFIDSLSVTGNVYNSYNLEAPEKTIVLMYRNLEDSAAMKEIPDYISRTDDNGYFRINNVHKGIYRLYALKDVDNSKNYNHIEEEFAFMNNYIEVTPEKNYIPVVKDTISNDTVKNDTVINDISTRKTEDKVIKDDEPEKPVVKKGKQKLFMFIAPKKIHYLSGSSRDINYKLIYTLSLPPDSMKFEFSIPEVNDSLYFIERSRYNDTMTVWLTDSSLYNRQEITSFVKYPFTDTLGYLGYKEDTIVMRFLKPRVPKGVKIKKARYKISTNTTRGGLNPEQRIVFYSSTPFREPDTTRITLYRMSDTTRIVFNLVKDTLSSGKYYLNTDYQPGEKYLCIADSASFGNIYDESTDSTSYKFSVKDQDSFSSLILNITNYEGKRIIQLLDNSEKLIREIKTDHNEQLLFNYLDGGKYRIRAIYDLNGDGKWTTGDFEYGNQPEPVSYFPDIIEIKNGWEVEQDWDMGEQNVKDQKLREKKKDTRRR